VAYLCTHVHACSVVRAGVGVGLPYSVHCAGLWCGAGPAAAVATGSWLWGLISPSSHMLCSAMVALMAVAADYNRLGREVATGRIPPGS
jgi:hypothetical protein